MRRAPRTERRRGCVARLGVDEDSAPRVQRDGQAEAGRSAGARRGSPVGEGAPARIPSASKTGDPVGFGGLARTGCENRAGAVEQLVIF